MCTVCGTRMRHGSAVHASTGRHRRAIAPRAAGAWNRRRDAGEPAPAWTRSLRDWDDQYAEDEAAAIAAGWTPERWTA